MKINSELLQTITLRGENLVGETRLDQVLNVCLRAAINGFDFQFFNYDETNEDEVKEMEGLAEELNKLNLKPYFDGDPGRRYLCVNWD